MPKKKRVDLANAEVVGYIRVSRLVFPPACATVEARAEFVENVRRARVHELTIAAERNGDTIAAWYDDLGVSGLGEFLDKRVDFVRLWDDIRHGRVRAVYACELARMSRDFADSDLFFSDAEDAGVSIYASDLPTVNPNESMEAAATRKAVRRTIVAWRENDAIMGGYRVRHKLGAKFEKGDILGFHRDVWGLRYVRREHRFVVDDTTAPQVQRLFQMFIDHGGIALRVSDQLNREALGGSVESRSPTGKMWNASNVLRTIRNPLYRQQIIMRSTRHGNDAVEILERHDPDRIPVVVDRAIVDEALRLATARSGGNKQSPAKRRPFTYSGLMVCGHCGSRMRAQGYSKGRVEPPLTGVRWLCTIGRESRPLCPEHSSVNNLRVDTLVGRAVQQAFEQSLSWLANARPTDTLPKRPARDFAAEIAEIDRQAARFHELYAAGIIKTLDALTPYLAALDSRRKAIDKAQATTPAEAVAPTPAASPEAWRTMLAHTREIWSAEPIYYDAAKADLLADLGARFYLSTSRRISRRGNVVAGPATLRAEFAALGFTGDRAITITEE